MTQRIERSFSIFLAVATNSFNNAKLIALRLSGRFKETVAIPLFFSTRKSAIYHTLIVFDWGSIT